MKILIETVENGFIVTEYYLETSDQFRGNVFVPNDKRKVFNNHRQLNSYLNKNLVPTEQISKEE